MQAFCNRRDCCNLLNLAFKLAARQHGKHTSAKLKRAKFDNNESYKTFARRHNRRKSTESLKQQAARVWGDSLESSRGSNRREATGVHIISDEMVWQLMFSGGSSPKADKQQRKAWKAWTKQFKMDVEDTEFHFSWTDHRASNDQQSSRSAKSDRRHQNEWVKWQRHGHAFSSWDGDFEGWYQSESEPQAAYTFRQARAGKSQQKARQQSSLGSFAQRSTEQHQCMRVLGVSVLEPSLLKQAFLECAKKWHPDRHADDAKAVAESKFKEAQTAYQYLLTCL